jgi:phosphoribosylamine--glycine ligase
MAQYAECVSIDSEDTGALAAFAESHHVDLVVVGPDGALAAGVVDAVEEKGIRAFGPTKAAAEIEWSKAFAKQLMIEDGIPTAAFSTFTDVDAANAYVKQQGVPIVVKADGLAAGKGAIVCMTESEALKALDDIMVGTVFGEAGQCVVIEEFMTGEEASVFALTDGEVSLPMIPTQDHKQIYEGDKGPNTGGMGAYAPAPLIDEEMLDQIHKQIIIPTIRGLKTRGRIYRGVLYCGIMMTPDGPKVVEFNSRFGDPEAQVLFPLLEDDFTELALAISEGNLPNIPLKWQQKAATCVVVASKGYPGSYEKGKPISGMDRLEAMQDVIPFHADTAVRDGQLVTNGGRILGVTAIADDLPSSIDRAYEAVGAISFDNLYCRRDIGQKALKH